MYIRRLIGIGDRGRRAWIAREQLQQYFERALCVLREAEPIAQFGESGPFHGKRSVNSWFSARRRDDNPPKRLVAFTVRLHLGALF